MVPTLCPQFIELAIHSKMIKSIEMIYIFVIACSRNRNRSDRTIICICACRNGVRCHFNRLLHWNVASVAYILCGTWELILHTEAKITNDENVKSINDGMQTHLVAVQCTFTQAQTHSRHISGICVCVCVCMSSTLIQKVMRVQGKGEYQRECEQNTWKAVWFIFILFDLYHCHWIIYFLFRGGWEIFGFGFADTLFAHATELNMWIFSICHHLNEGKYVSIGEIKPEDRPLIERYNHNEYRFVRWRWIFTSPDIYRNLVKSN